MLMPPRTRGRDDGTYGRASRYLKASSCPPTTRQNSHC